MNEWMNQLPMVFWTRCSYNNATRVLFIHSYMTGGVFIIFNVNIVRIGGFSVQWLTHGRLASALVNSVMILAQQHLVQSQHLNVNSYIFNVSYAVKYVQCTIPGIKSQITHYHINIPGGRPTKWTRFIALFVKSLLDFVITLQNFDLGWVLDLHANRQLVDSRLHRFP